MSEQSSPILLQFTVHPGNLQSPAAALPIYPNHRHMFFLATKILKKQSLKNICDIAGGPDGLAGDDEPAGGGPPVLGLGLRVAAQAELHSQPQEADRGPESAGQDGGQ